ncbi:MAG: pyruvate dehydrogenase complex dihydrolipoamide acetyltransferase [Micavibrio sp.]|nr:pyruvate dehydrogenase complex dihydrolipoamide acetyltransferase [Micavibrio sp.]
MSIEITMPALSPTMEEGKLAKWLKSEGDTVEAGDVIAEIETDKATMEVEAVDEGVLGKILISEGTEAVKVNTPIAILLEDGEDKSALENLSSKKSNDDQKPADTKKEAPKVEKAPAVDRAPDAPKSNSGDRIFATPLARRIAADKGIDLTSVKGTGPRGRIVKADLEGSKVGAAATSQTTSSASPTTSAGIDAKKQADLLGMEYEMIPNNNIKKVTARRLTEAKQTVPHFYLTVDCVLDNLLAARKEMNEAANGEYKLSVNDFIIKANAMALKSYPAANTSWSDEGILQYKHADISVAVATPNGLITPIIKKAETKGLRDISDEMKELAGRAREGKLKPEEFQGGTFSISNLGMFGVKDFQAIINPPQSCIMAVGAGEQRPVVENGEVKIRTVMSVTLSTDHRSVDGAVGAEFLQHFKRYIENPVNMLV